MKFPYLCLAEKEPGGIKTVTVGMFAAFPPDSPNTAIKLCPVSSSLPLPKEEVFLFLFESQGEGVNECL
jgi:hypothetical protein